MISTLTGLFLATQGTFGVVRGIEETGMQANATGESFLVNVIFQESWFNITGMNGGNFFGGAGVGRPTTKHGTTKPFNPTGTTEPFVWCGVKPAPDASEEDFPERSPQQRNATAPQAEDGLGNLRWSKTGLMPIPLVKDDRLRLADQEGITLTVLAGDTRIDVREPQLDRH